MQSEAGKGSRQRKPHKDRTEEAARNWADFERKVEAEMIKKAKEKQR
tara:strand:- start:1492 stop:1632 length:141 start_codon:yes stop_codon:yes gene_type:complete